MTLPDMRLALFDLDNTLLAGDSDHAWGEFLISTGLVDATRHRAQNDAFYAAYRQGRLDIQAFLQFQLAPLSRHPKAQLLALRTQYLTTLTPLYLPAATQLIAWHRARGDRLAIITATNRFITAPIAAQFGISDLLATTPEETEAGYTGRYVGTPTFREGKVQVLREWLAEQRLMPQDIWAYSDSINDEPLLACATHPVAVDPDPRLARLAAQRGWPCVTLRAGTHPLHCDHSPYRLTP